MAMFSSMLHYSGEEWKQFFLIGIVILTGIGVIYLWHLRKITKKNKKNDHHQKIGQ